MINSQDLLFFSSVASAPSLAQASRVLNVTAPAVSQRLKILEDKLGVKLIDRARGSMRLTSEGEFLQSRAAGILSDLSLLGDEFTCQIMSVSGTLRVVAPLGFGRIHVSSIMERFKVEHPGISINLHLSDAPYSFTREEAWDVIISIGKLPGSSLVQKRFAPNRRVLCASPSYLEANGFPQDPKNLAYHACGVVHENEDDATLWTFQRKDGSSKGKAITHRVAPSFACNDGGVVKYWAKSGMGIIERSEWDVSDELNTGSLIEVLPNYQLPDADIVVLASQRTLRVVRTQTFLDFLRKDISSRAAHGWCSEQFS